MKIDSAIWLFHTGCILEPQLRDDDLMTAYTRYPLVQKALAEQRAIFAAAPDGVPAELAAATNRACTLIDENVATSDDVKECILTVCVLMHCPPYMALKSERFATDYHPHVQAMLDTHTKGIGVTADNTDLVQVYSAMFTAHAENLQRAIVTTVQPERDWLIDIRDSLSDFADDRTVYADGIAPKLRAIEDQQIALTLSTINAAISALDAPKQPKATKAPKAPKSGPKPPKSR